MVELKTIKERYLKIAVLILALIAVLFVFFSKNINKNLLIVVVGAGFFAYLLLSRKKQNDIYAIARIIQLRHYKVTGELLDISSIQATEMPMNSGRLLINFKNNARVFEYSNNLILGTQINEMSSIVSKMERSRIVEQAAKTQTVRERIKEGAKRLGIDPGSIGLEEG